MPTTRTAHEVAFPGETVLAGVYDLAREMKAPRHLTFANGKLLL